MKKKINKRLYYLINIYLKVHKLFQPQKCSGKHSGTRIWPRKECERNSKMQKAKIHILEVIVPHLPLNMGLNRHQPLAYIWKAGNQAALENQSSMWCHAEVIFFFLDCFCLLVIPPESGCSGSSLKSKPCMQFLENPFLLYFGKKLSTFL